MFALILPPRPVLTPPLAISPTQFAFTFPSLPSFQNIVIFLLPGNTLPPDAAAAIYIQFPGKEEFRLLGAIGNEKPSVIFRVNGDGAVGNGAGVGLEGGGGGGGGEGGGEVDMDAEVIPTDNNLNGGSVDSSSGSAALGFGDITIGISIEPASAIAAQLASSISSSSSVQPSPSTALTIVKQQQQPPLVSTKVLAQRIIRNAFNFLASFVGEREGEEVVPLKAFRDWWGKFERRVDNDPGFLEREGDY